MSAYIELLHDVEHEMARRGYAIDSFGLGVEVDMACILATTELPGTSVRITNRRKLIRHLEEMAAKRCEKAELPGIARRMHQERWPDRCDGFTPTTRKAS